MTFGLSDTASCERCGSSKPSSDVDCTHCSPEDLERFHFEHVSTNEVVTVETVQGNAWDEVMKKVDEPLPWKCVETGALSVDVYRMGTDVRELWEEHNEE